jgi:colicin import membrane protein
VQAIQRHDPGTNASAVLAIGVHLLLFAVLFFGIRWRTKHPEPVMAELWSQLPAVEAPRAEPPPPVVAPKSEPKPEPRPEPKPEPKAEPKPAPKPDIALEQEKKRKEEAEKKKREEEALKRKREEELKAKAEKERKDKELAEQRRREEQAAERKRMQDQVARELAGAAPKAGAPAAVQGVPGPAGDPGAVAAWTDQIRAKVKSNIVLPSDLVGNPEAVFDVFLLPTGEVQSVKLERPSGNKALDEAWERAILKSSPLPMPAKAEVFRRDLRLRFKPRD